MKRFSKKLSLVLLAAMLVIGLIGCSSTAKIETAPGITVAAPASAEKQETASSAPAPAPAPEKSEPAPAPESSTVVAPLAARTISMFGYSAKVKAYDGNAVVTYPRFVTSDDIATAIKALNAAYPGELAGVTYEVVKDGEMKVYYPEGISSKVLEGYLDVLTSDLAYYLSTLDITIPEKEEVVYLGGIKEIEKNDSGEEEFDLYVVHTNDVHARIVPADGGMGYSKFSSLLKMARNVTDDILLLDAGDVSHGTNLANVFQGETVGVLLDMLGYDAVAPGNHDFNYGYEALSEKAKLAQQYSNLRVLAANITDADGNLVFQPYEVYDYNGKKVVVIGLTTPDTKTKAHPKYTQGIEFMSDAVVNNAQALLDYANEIGDFVIVVGHIGLDADGSSGVTSDWIVSNLKGIDLFVDGHSHTTLEHGMQVGDTLIVSTGEYLKNFGVVRVHFSDKGAEILDARLVSAEEVNNPAGTILDTAFGIKEVPNDPEVDAYVEKMQAELDKRFGQVIATVPTDLDGAREHVRTRKTNLSKLIVAAMTSETGADFTITNGGGIRASISKGDVTLGDVNNVLPFTNTISVCEITPSEVYAALEHGYSMLPETNGGYAQTDLQVIYSKTAPAGSRILRVLLNGKLLDRNDTTTIYTVATNDFLGAGGDGYTMFGREVQVGRMLNEVFADYLAKVYPPKN